MVLVHKLKEMEALDIEQFRDKEDVDDDEEEQNDSENPTQPLPPSSKRVASPPRRPLTRSQTGRVAKRKPRDDSPVSGTRKTAPSRKKNKPSRKREKSDTELEIRQEMQPSPPPETPSIRSASQTPAPPPDADVPPLNHTQLTFLDSSSLPGTLSDRRGPRSRAVLPTPVPNLTKKSRGRRVPTKLPTDNEIEQKETRVYVCTVEDCGKCFNRGEHLKRHIRSIHTHEKPFQCSHPGCDKFFNRHDNLLQHLKVHKELAVPQTPFLENAVGMSPLQPQQRLPFPSEMSTFALQSKRPFVHAPPPFSPYSNTTPYGSGLEPVGFATNMAVSSLRTEMPHSPQVPYSQMRYSNVSDVRVLPSYPPPLHMSNQHPDMQNQHPSMQNWRI